MEPSASFDLPQFMFSHFPCVDFGGDLFGQWPVGIRFEIGSEQVARATEIYEFVFGQAVDCILVSQEFDGQPAERFTQLFSTPGIFPISSLSQFQTVEVSPFDETPYRLTWTRVPPLSFNVALMFQACANADLGGTPSIAGRAYAIDHRTKIIMHMYDDRGLDVIAANASALLPVYDRFSDWILDNQRHRIEFRFKNFLAESRSPVGETE
jgi:hypothetical protein